MPKKSPEPKPVERDWTPVRRKDGTYCSPACGGKCTHQDYLEAKAMAEDIARQLGPKWKVHVHENLGWFGCAYLGDDPAICPCSVRKDKGLTSSPTPYHALMFNRYSGCGRTPLIAVKNAFLGFQQEVNENTNAYTFILESVDWKGKLPKK